MADEALIRVVLDIETTGTTDHDDILEIGAVLVDPAYMEVASFNAVRGFRTAGQISMYDPVVQDMHTKNGLWAECDLSPLPLHDIDATLAAWFQVECGATPKSVVLCGRTIDFDHRFITRQCPRAAAYLHYRKDDLGAISRFLKDAGYPVELLNTPKEDMPHRGLEDARIEARDASRMLRLLRETREDAGKYLSLCK